MNTPEQPDFPEKPIDNDVFKPEKEISDTQKETKGRSMNVLALVKGSERYVYLYDDESPGALLQQLGKHAADSELSFTWYDAAVLSQKVRRMKQERSNKSESKPERFRPTTSEDHYPF